ncbi:hypothetical protein [Chryseobacterium gossypii]|uniref:hypothetical protein n=1 Tax=Chryseobacterium gossypii TaxID=3231602 RepID=UPI003523EB74
MNPRVLELLKNPKNIQSEDLYLLKEEINSFPYIQNIRALHLYGVHLYDKENYQKELTTTAAYTTDKKILYQLINGKIQQKPKTEIVTEKPGMAKNTFKYIYESKGFPIKREEKQPKAQKEACYVLPASQTDIKYVYVNGERNRILFEGEENFLLEAAEVIDVESTLESGTLVTQRKQEKPKFQDDNRENDFENQKEVSGTPETIIEEDKISSTTEKEEITDTSELSFQETASFLPEVNIPAAAEKDTEESGKENRREDGPASPSASEADEISSGEEKQSPRDNGELSFHGLDSFMPEVKIRSNAEQAIKSESQRTENVNRHEEEMRRLIEEVEKKMKAGKAVAQKEMKNEPEAEGHEISFAETQSFHVASAEEKAEQKQETEKPEEVKPEKHDESVQQVEKMEAVAEVRSSWKPMNIETHIPDSLIDKPAHAEPRKVEASPETKPEHTAILPEIKDLPDLKEDRSEEFVTADGLKEDPQMVESREGQNEAPVMNVSFFSSDISSWTIQPAKEEGEGVEKETGKSTVEKPEKAPAVSNVPGFINTWQNWLKIDRSEKTGKEKVENKLKVIDTFIENNPKISQLKEESNYVIKEKTDDISHLMTETLANLYFEQKLYAKAIRAFEILIDKNPDKKEYFEKRIQEIKDFRNKN